MIIIKTSDLKDFFKRAGKIKRRNILPVLNFIELVVEGNDATLTKSNQNYWIRQHLQVESKSNVSMLLDEDTILAFLAKPTDDFITIKQVKNKVTYTSGKRDISHGVWNDEKTHYPPFPGTSDDSRSKPVILQPEFVSLLHMGALIVTEVPEYPSSYVCVTSNKQGYYVDSTNRSIAFRCMLKDKAPKMELCRETCNLISTSGQVEYSFTDHYDFFDTGIFTYACVKAAIKPLQFDVLYEKYNTENNFKISRQALVDFCDTCISISPTAVLKELDFVEIKCKIKGNDARLSYVNNESGKNHFVDEKIENDGFLDYEATLNAKLLKNILETVPYEKIGISKPAGVNGLYIFCDDFPEYKGLIIELVPKPVAQ